MFKKFVSLAMVIIIALNLLPVTGLAAEKSNGAALYFDDVSDHWCLNIINDFYNNGAIKGYDIGGKHFFKPDNLITRAEFAEVLSKYLNIQAFKGYEKIDFKDVSEGTWYKKAVDMVSGKGFVKGYPDKTFKPNEPIKRDEITAMSATFVRKNGEAVEIKYDSCFPDVKKGDWFFDDVAQLREKKIADGYPDGYFKPDRHATRAEAIKLLYNLKMKMKEIINEEVPKGGNVVPDDSSSSSTSSSISAGSSSGSSSSSDSTPVPKLNPSANADFKVNSTYLRDTANGNSAHIVFNDSSTSANTSIINRTWTVRYDSNGDSDFSDEKAEIIDSNNNTAPVYNSSKVGRYQAELSITAKDTPNQIGSKLKEVKTFTIGNTEPKASFDIQKKKKLDMVITIGKADSSKINTLSSRIEDFKKICIDNGIDAKVTSTSVQSLTASDSFNWQEYDHYNYKDFYAPTLPKHITVTGSSIKMIGYSATPMKDFLFVPDENKTQKTFTFDLVRDGTDWHSMEGGGFLFNSSIADGKLSGFCILVTGNGLKLDEIDGVDLQKFRDGSYEYVQNAGKQLGTYNIGDVYIKHSFKIVVDPTSISVWDNNKLVIDNYSLPDKNFGSGFGPIISHRSHSCSQMSYFTFTNILMTTVVGKSLSDVLDKPDWRPDSERILVNLSDDSVYDLLTDNKVADVSCKLLKNSVKFIGLGTDKSKPQYDSVITGTAQNGLCIDGTDIDAAISGMQDYILGKVKSKDYTASNKITTDDEITYSEKYTDTENDPEYSKQWKYIHDPSVFQNDNGKAAFDGSLLNSPIAAFDKVGKYDISLRVQDNPVGNNLEEFRKWSDEKLSTRTISVSRKPLAQLKAYVTKDSSGNFITHVIENSYDPDHKSDSDTGIVSKEYSWKNIKDSQWTSGNLPDQLLKDSNYLLKLVVKDNDDTYSDPAVELLSTDSQSSLVPKVTSFPVSSGKEGDPYTYTVTAVSAEGDKLTYALTNSPKGMTIDSSTGAIKWNPTGEQSGVTLVTVKITDAKGLSSTQSFTINVEEAINSTPAITSTPITSGKEGEAYLYNLTVTDADNDPLQISINPAPSGMKLTSTSSTVNKQQTCAVSWTPGGTQSGKHHIKITVDDKRGGITTHEFDIDIAEAINTNPVISSSPVLNVKAGEEYKYNVIAADGDNDPLTYSLVKAPDGMTIDSKSGVISWTPDINQAGKSDVSVKVSDGRGGEAVQSFSVAISGKMNNAPSITSVPVTQININANYTYSMTATDADGDTLTYSLVKAPDGMTINTASGLLSWTPSASQKGTQAVAVKVDDGNGGSVTQDFTITVVKSNTIPVITSMPSTSAKIGVLYTYSVTAADSDGDTLTYSLAKAPDSMTINAASGLLSWTPSAAHNGTQAVAVKVDDGNGGSVTQDFTITVVENNSTNQIPAITSTAPSTAQPGKAYTYSIKATGYNGNQLTYALIVSPKGMIIDSASGLVSWTPDSSQSGSNNVSIEITDSKTGAKTIQSFTINVSGKHDSLDTTKPVVSLTILPKSANAGDTVKIAVTAADDIGVASKTLFVNNLPVTLNASGEAFYTSSSTGIFKVEATASDASGNQGFAQDETAFTKKGDTVKPTVTLTTPTAYSKLSSDADIIGTAVDDVKLISYKLEYSEKNKNNFITFASASSPVSNGKLGEFDTTTLNNGLYDIRLTAVDESGNTNFTTITYQVDGNEKIGNFSIGFNDLTIPVSGIPITITRTYDSRSKSSGDFGIGWSMGLNNIKLSESGPLGKNWTQTVSGGMIALYSVKESEPHYVIVTYPDGSTDEFDMVLTPNSSRVVPVSDLTVSFKAKSGTFSKLESLDDNYCYITGSTKPNASKNDIELTYFDVLSRDKTYSNERYKLTRKDGTVIIINKSSGVESIQDANGNKLSVTSNGLIHSSGKSVTFTRDAQGRITSITDPMGNVIKYEYDFYGDLVKTINPAGNVTKFTYNKTHGLTSIVDARGVKPVRNEYDDSGRLIATIDAEGNKIEYTHDLDSRKEVVKDRMGNVTVVSYDENGNILSKTDALGNTTSYTYDSSGNKLSEKDALGNVTSYTYDKGDHILSTTNPMGFKTEYTYLESGKPLTVTDPMGNVQKMEYDSNENLKGIIYADGNELTYTGDSNGNITKTVDSGNNTTTYTYDSSGNILSETAPDGKVSEFTYNADGKTLTSTVWVNGKKVTTSYEYDSMNHIVKITDSLGNVTKTEYNELGRKSAETDKHGNRTEFEYDIFGNLSAVKHSDNTKETYTYDLEGRKLTSTDRAGNTTSYTYDKLGRLVKTTYPDSTFTQIKYNEIGQATCSTDECGNVTKYEYDAAGHTVLVTDALGYSTKYEYDKNGNKIKMTDANNHSTQYEYNASGKITKTVFADGSFTSASYDILGRNISKTDQAGKTTTYEYDPVGKLSKATDALGNSNTYTYDELGYQLTQTNANGHTTSFEYDSLGRKVKRTVALGMTESIKYDESGNIVEQTDFNGNTIKFDYNAYGQMTKKVYPDSKNEEYTYNTFGQKLSVTNSTGTVKFEYNSRSRITKQENSDGTVISYTYDAAGNRTSVTAPSGTTTYTYDALNRLSTVTDPDGGVTLYTYDKVGNRLSTTYPTGDAAEYTYDSLNRLTKLVNHKSNGEIISSYEYTLGPIGNRTKVAENTGRTVSYTYDDVYRLLKEEISEPSKLVHIISYTYDAAGNRLTKTDDGITTNYSYDENERLIKEGSYTYTYDNNGSTLSKTGNNESIEYSYDYERRLIKTVSKNASGTSTAQFIYDFDGARREKIVDGKSVTFLVDRNRECSQVIEERDENGVLIVSYIHGNDLISQKRGAVTNYYIYDGQGSTRLLTDSSSNISDTYTYDAFGLLLSKTGNTVNDYLYTGEQYDPNLGFYYLRSRYMNPATGRFLTLDSFEGDIYAPKSLHKYTYCANDPIDYVDYLGLEYSWVLGTYIHQHIESMYPGMTLRKLLGSAMIPDFFENLFPDIADPVSKDVYEIKPASEYGLAGWHQLMGYIISLNFVGLLNPTIGVGWHPGGWCPSMGPHTLPQTGTQYLVVGNASGVIFYWYSWMPIKSKVWEKIKEKAVSFGPPTLEDIDKTSAQLDMTAFQYILGNGNISISQTIAYAAVGSLICYSMGCCLGFF